MELKQVVVVCCVCYMNRQFPFIVWFCVRANYVMLYDCFNRKQQ